MAIHSPVVDEVDAVNQLTRHYESTSWPGLGDKSKTNHAADYHCSVFDERAAVEVFMDSAFKRH